MTTIIYHSADFDGKFSGQIAQRVYPGATMIGWTHGDAPIVPPSGYIYVLDLPPTCLTDIPNRRVAWIDHHKSALDNEKFKSIPGLRIDGVAACRLAWQYFNAPGCGGLTKEHFVERRVSEPRAVRMVGEYDVWDKRDPQVDTLQFGLRLDELKWPLLLQEDETAESRSYLNTLLEKGAVAQKYMEQRNASIARSCHLLHWEDLTFIALNVPMSNSLVFDSVDLPGAGHDAVLTYAFNGRFWDVRMYHSKHNRNLDLSQIAVKHGGGGHKGACGFECLALPFSLSGNVTL